MSSCDVPPKARADANGGVLRGPVDVILDLAMPRVCVCVLSLELCTDERRMVSCDEMATRVA